MADRKIQIQPSILAAPIGRLEEACLYAEECGADGLHVDIMDGHFVPNVSLGPPVVAMAKKMVDLHLSVHLMMTNPDRYLRPFIEAGADTLHIHIEPDYDVKKALRDIRGLGVRPGITLNPETPVDSIFPVLDDGLVDEVLVMSVHPGFGGQSFIPDVLPKAAAVRARLPDIDISMDGGIDLNTAVDAAAHGVNIFIAGSSLFNADRMAEDIAEMRRRAAEAFCSSV